MSTENQNSDFLNFRKYYNGDMSSKERTVFEENLENDPFAKDAYEGFLMFEKDFDRISAIEKTNMAFKAKVGIESSTSLNLKPLMAIAASLVVLFSAFYIIQNGTFNNNSEVAKNSTSEQEIIFDDQKVEIETSSEEISSDSLIENEIELLDESIIISDVIEKEDILEKVDLKPIKEKEKFVNPAPIQNIGSNKKQINAEDFYNNNQKDRAEQGVVIPSNEVTEEVVSENKSFYNSLYYNDDKAKEESDLSETLSSFKSGIVAYNQSNYNKAIQKFEASLKAKKSINSSNYYLGMSYFNLNKHNKAINAFDKVISSSSNFSDDAMWYKSLSLISKGQKTKAKILLQSLANMNSSFKNSAQKKLETL